jgi:hypothetical protein
MRHFRGVMRRLSGNRLEAYFTLVSGLSGDIPRIGLTATLARPARTAAMECVHSLRFERGHCPEFAGSFVVILKRINKHHEKDK